MQTLRCFAKEINRTLDENERMALEIARLQDMNNSEREAELKDVIRFLLTGIHKCSDNYEDDQGSSSRSTMHSLMGNCSSAFCWITGSDAHSQDYLNVLIARAKAAETETGLYRKRKHD